MGERIVLVRLSALGDIVHTWPLAVALKAHGIASSLTWVVEAPFAPLVEGHPAVDRVVTVTTRAWRRRPLAPATLDGLRALRRELEAVHPGLAIDPQGVAKSALVTRLVPAGRRVGLARPYRRERLAGLAYSETIPVPPEATHVVGWNLAFATALGAPAFPGPPAPDGRWLLGPEAPGRDPGLAVLLPGAGQPGKVLPEETLAEVGRRLTASGLRPVVAWGPGERDRAGRIAGLCNGEVAPPTTIPELAALLARASVAVGADTGPVHLAASLGTPTVGVHLTTDAVRNAPLGPRVAVVSGARPGTGRRAAARTGMLRIPGAREIADAALELLGKERSAPLPEDGAAVVE